jgi:bifunctional DNA-binding transcriptional regulator/antitoxin component of YhaV-PrlF toxin-antitoxin module
LIGTWDLAMQPTNETTKSWICDVDEDGVLVFPDELWDLMGWKEGDTIEFIDQKDGSFLLRKVDELPDSLDHVSTVEKAVKDDQTS